MSADSLHFPHMLLV